MVKLPDFNPLLISKAKDGYENDALQLIRHLVDEVKQSPLRNSNLQAHLLGCLERTIEFEDANAGFYLKNKRGKKKQDTLLRDYRAAELMVASEDSDLKYEQRLEEAALQVNYDFSEMIMSPKAVGAAYTELKPIVILNQKIK